MLPLDRAFPEISRNVTKYYTQVPRGHFDLYSNAVSFNSPAKLIDKFVPVGAQLQMPAPAVVPKLCAKAKRFDDFTNDAIIIGGMTLLLFSILKGN